MSGVAFERARGLILSITLALVPWERAVAEEGFPGAPTPPAGNYEAGMQVGKDFAGTKSVMNWALVGGASGCILPVVGCLGATYATVNIKPDPPETLNLGNQTPDFDRGYVVGYQTEIRTRRARAAMLGGLVGSVLIPGLLFAFALAMESATTGSPARSAERERAGGPGSSTGPRGR